MRILYLTHLVPYPPASGVALRTYHITKLLAMENEVDIVALVQNNILKGLAQDAARSRYSGETGVRVVGTYPIRERGTLGKSWTLFRAHMVSSPYESAWLRQPVFEQASRSCIRDGGYDLIIVDTIGLFPSNEVAWPCRVVLGHHNVESHLAAQRAIRRRGIVRKCLEREAKLINVLERRAASKVRDHMVPSARDARLLEEVVEPHRPHTWIVPSGVDTSHFVRGDKRAEERPIDMVFMGSIGWHPNREAVASLAREVAPEVSRLLRRLARTSVVGQRDGYERQLAAVKGAGVTFTGFVEDPGVILRDSKVFVAPLAYGGGTKLKVLTAMACGLPVVTTEAGAEGLDVTEDDGVFVCHGAMEIARVASSLIENEDRWDAAASAARACVVRRFDWLRIKELLDKLLVGTN